MAAPALCALLVWIARSIFACFLAPNAEYEINVSAALRHQVAAALAETEGATDPPPTGGGVISSSSSSVLTPPAADVFDSCCEEALSLVEKNLSLSGFPRSRAYSLCWQIIDYAPWKSAHDEWHRAEAAAAAAAAHNK
jgi:hypothetical protein